MNSILFLAQAHSLQKRVLLAITLIVSIIPGVFIFFFKSIHLLHSVFISFWGYRHIFKWSYIEFLGKCRSFFQTYFQINTL